AVFGIFTSGVTPRSLPLIVFAPDVKSLTWPETLQPGLVCWRPSLTVTSLSVPVDSNTVPLLTASDSCTAVALTVRVNTPSETGTFTLVDSVPGSPLLAMVVTVTADEVDPPKTAEPLGSNFAVLESSPPAILL